MISKPTKENLVEKITPEKFLRNNNLYVVANSVKNVNKLSRAGGLHCLGVSRTYHKYLRKLEVRGKVFKSCDSLFKYGCKDFGTYKVIELI